MTAKAVKLYYLYVEMLNKIRQKHKFLFYWFNYWHIAAVSIFSGMGLCIGRMVVWDKRTGFIA